MFKGKRRHKIWMRLSFIVLLIFPLSGCWDSTQSERMVYVQGLGVDYNKGKYTVYVQLINLSLLAKSESGGGGTQTINSEIGQSSGNSVEDAIYNLYKNSQRRLHWGHLTYIILTNSALQHKGLQAVADIYNRYYEAHYHMWIYSTTKQINKVLNTMPPLNMSTYLSRLSDPDAAFGQYSFIQSIDMREVIISHNVPPNEIIIPFISNSKKVWKGDGEPRNIGVIKGVSIIDHNTLKGNILNSDINGYRWMEKKFKRTGLSFQTQGNANMGLIITKRKVKIEPIIKNNNIQFDIQIKASAIINKLEKNVSASQLNLEAENIIKNEVLKTYEKGLEIDSDIYQLSNILYKKNYKIWKKVQVKGKIPLMKESIRNINVEVMVMDSGKQRKIPALND